MSSLVDVPRNDRVARANTRTVNDNLEAEGWRESKYRRHIESRSDGECDE